MNVDKLAKKLLSRRNITSSECWEFTGSRDLRGYGRMADGKGTERVHRLAYQIWVGSIEGKLICHRCDNPPCFNPDHLFSGTSRDNQQDASRKGRSRGKWMPGMLSVHAKLTDDKVMEIRALYKPYVMTVEKLANKYGLSIGCITKVVHNESWKHIKVAGK